MSPTESFRIMVVGEKRVGKSALVVKYLTGRFIGEYQSDVEQKYQTKVLIKGEEIAVELIDSISEDENIIQWAEGFMIVYDVTNRKSFDRIRDIRKELKHLKTAKNMSCVVVGTKTDLQHCRKITADMAEKFCLDIAVAHFECCACAANDDSLTENLREAIEELCREIQTRRRVNSENRPRRRPSFVGVKQGLKMLVTPSKNKGHLSPSVSTLSLNTRRGSNASIGRRDSVAEMVPIEGLKTKYRSSGGLRRSVSNRYGSSLSVKQ